jgi:predicted amidophosphoribosyltransferase
VGPVLLLTVCGNCRAAGPSPCDGCLSELRPAPALPDPPGVDAFRAALAYEGAGREIVARLKYRNERAALAWLADRMAAVAPAGAQVITWAPTTTRRRRRRGFDQAELLARAIAARLDLPCRSLLRRRPGPPQTGRSRSDRQRGPYFTARRGADHVLVVDDVCTTGATLAAASAALRRAGAAAVVAVTAARTPR